MAAIELALPRACGAAAVSRWARQFAAMLQRELQSRREIAWLMEQDDRMLGDLGVSRHEIARVIRYGRDA